jgi:dephospho-CoA kinase
MSWVGERWRTPEHPEPLLKVVAEMIKVGLTGNVASGKSEVASVWSGAGVPVVRADDLAREVVAPGSAGLDAVVREFGEKILASDGSLDRAELRDRVFRDPGERKRLEGILHPLIAEERQRWVRARIEEGAPLIVAEIPLLYELGMEEEFDLIVVVRSEEAERKRRLVECRGLEPEEANRIMEAQMAEKEKVQRADFVLDNGSTLPDLQKRALALLDLLRARSRRRDEP